TYSNMLYVLLVAPAFANAQDSLEVDSFIIVKEFRPSLSAAPKIRVNPEISDSQNLDVKVNYQFLNKELPHDFDPESIKAAKLKGEPLVKLYRNYFILGYGNNATPIAEFYYNQLRSKKSSIGVYGKHFSSTGIKDIENSNFSNNALGISASRYSRKYTIGGRLDYRYDAMNYYGYDETRAIFGLNDQLNSVNLSDLNENVGQNYNRFKAIATFGNNQRDTAGLRHYSEASYSYLADRYESSESRFTLLQSYSLVHTSQILTLDWALDYNKLTDGSRWSISQYSKENTIFMIEPGIDLRGKNWRLEGAFKVAAEFDVETSYYLYPKVDFKYNLVKSIIVPYIGITGDLNRNSYSSFTDENPFVGSAIPLKNSNQSFMGYAGIRGHLSKNTSFNVSLSQQTVKDLPLYVKDTSNLESRSFTVIYDEVDITEFKAELIYEPIERWRLVISGSYFIYDAKNELQAWHKPQYRLSALTTYMLGDKIKAEILLYLIGEQSAKVYLPRGLAGYETLKGTTDINLNLEYRYSKRIAVFLDFNNIAAIKYEKWQDYPTQSLNVLGGFRFGF
ncbi:MAG: hypothetical protein RIC15_11180, partial [Vicingaceae bacterium]